MVKIKKIDIEKFGSFKDFKHDKNIDAMYEDLNIFYGRNYSGKSTLSKIFQAFERSELPDNYDSIAFTLKSDTRNFQVSDIDGTELTCKVFNADFVRKNLNFFNAEDGINCFTLSVGENNKEIEEQIKSLSDSHGMILALIEKEANSLKISKQNLNDKISVLDRFLRNSARELKNESEPRIATTNYNRNNFENEISQANEQPFLTNDEKKQYKSTIMDETKDPPPKKYFPVNKYLEAQKFVNNLLVKHVIPSQILKEIEGNSQKEQWVKQGLALHKHKEGNDAFCAFCGNKIDENRYKLLDSIFNDAVKNLERELESGINRLQNIKNDILEIDEINENSFYSKFHLAIIDLNEKIVSEKHIQILFIDKLISLLREKQDSLFSVLQMNTDDLPTGFEKISIIYNEIYQQHSEMSIDLSKTKDEARNALRLNTIKEMLKDNKYDDMRIAIAETQSIFKNIDDKYKNSLKELSDNEAKQNALLSSLSNEKNAANAINAFLNNSLGHEELMLDVAQDNDSQSKFHVLRHNEPAYNLSEGEMSLIAFAYFLTTLKCLSPTQKKNTIVFIDDPISSLDENNIFYIYSLIYSEIAKSEYPQVFMTTHNLDLLKYALKLPGRKKFFLISKNKKSDGTWNSKIQLMPKFMHMRVTEFNFLFEQIFIVATEEQNDSNYSVFYNFPNNARKFLEIYLYFKYPNYKDDNTDKYTRFFESDIDKAFIERVGNEYSHAGDRLDRLSKPVNSAEFRNDAQLIIKTMKEKDPEQYQSFLKNSTLTDPLI